MAVIKRPNLCTSTDREWMNAWQNKFLFWQIVNFCNLERLILISSLLHMAQTIFACKLQEKKSILLTVESWSSSSPSSAVSVRGCRHFRLVSLQTKHKTLTIINKQEMIILYTSEVMAGTSDVKVKLKYWYRAVTKRRGPGIFPGYYEHGPRLLSNENGRKIERKEIPSCLIPRLLFVFAWQLEILVTTLTDTMSL